MTTILDRILVDVRSEISAAKSTMPLSEAKKKLRDAPPVRSLSQALRDSRFGVIAEIKEKSPSVGGMRRENVAEAPRAYAECDIVLAISVLTNFTHFGGTIHHLESLRTKSEKPLLRKDFLLEEYQVLEARAFGADAVLLMASVLDASRLAGLASLAAEHGMDVLFEVHSPEEIAMLPSAPDVVGINSRKFRAASGFSGAQGHSEKDFSVDLSVFDLVAELPAGCCKVAESGISVTSLPLVSSRFDAALIGTSLLRDPRGIRAPLQEIEETLSSLSPS